MSDTTTEPSTVATTDTATTTDTTTTTDPPDDTTTDTGDMASLRREAATYRRALRAAEAERDTLAGTVTTWQRERVETLATAAGLADGGDVWRDGTELAGLVTETGTVDADRVTEAVAALVAAHPHWAKPQTTATAAGIGTVGAPQPHKTGWADLLRGGST